MLISFSLKPAVFIKMDALRIVAVVTQPEYKENPTLSPKKFTVVSLDDEAMFIMSTPVVSIPATTKSAMRNPATLFYRKKTNHIGERLKFKIGRYPSLLKMRSLLRPGTIESGRA